MLTSILMEVALESKREARLMCDWIFVQRNIGQAKEAGNQKQAGNAMCK
jgi:hypothetical protein